MERDTLQAGPIYCGRRKARQVVIASTVFLFQCADHGEYGVVGINHEYEAKKQSFIIHGIMGEAIACALNSYNTLFPLIKIAPS